MATKKDEKKVTLVEEEELPDGTYRIVNPSVAKQYDQGLNADVDDMGVEHPDARPLGTNPYTYDNDYKEREIAKRLADPNYRTPHGTPEEAMINAAIMNKDLKNSYYNEAWLENNRHLLEPVEEVETPNLVGDDPEYLAMMREASSKNKNTTASTTPVKKATTSTATTSTASSAAASRKAEVDAQDARDRVWNSLDYSYGKEREASNRAYDQQIAATGREMQKRGMQRSSYGEQIQANQGNEKIKAENDIWDKQVADYANRVYQIDRDTVADEQWLKQFIENQRQFDTNLQWQSNENALNRSWQSSENALNRELSKYQTDTQNTYNYAALAQNQSQFNSSQAQNQSQFDANLNYNYANLAQQKELTEAQLAQNQSQFNSSQDLAYAQLAQQLKISEAELAQSKDLTLAQLAQNKELTLAQLAQQLNISQAELEQNKNLTLAQLAQNKELTYAQLAQNLKLSEAELAQNKELTLAQLAQSKDLTLAQLAQALQISQAELAQAKDLTLAQLAQSADQFDKEFGLKASSTEQQIALGIVTSIAENGGDASDALLAMAKVSRADFNALKKNSNVSRSTGNTPAWKKYGYNNAEDYDAAQNGNFPDSSSYYAAKGYGLTTYSGYQRYLELVKNNKASDPLGLGGTTTTSSYKALNPNIMSHVASTIGEPNVTSKTTKET